VSCVYRRNFSVGSRVDLSSHNRTFMLMKTVNWNMRPHPIEEPQTYAC